MANERAWFVYNGAPSGEQTSTNYLYVSFFPACQTSGTLICSVKGIYDFETYGQHPAPFSLDTPLGDYIIEALAADVAYPPAPSFKPYVYVRNA
jgi:hypothetical protein